MMLQFHSAEWWMCRQLTTCAWRGIYKNITHLDGKVFNHYQYFNGKMSLFLSKQYFELNLGLIPHSVLGIALGMSRDHISFTVFYHIIKPLVIKCSQAYTAYFITAEVCIQKCKWKQREFTDNYPKLIFDTYR